MAIKKEKVLKSFGLHVKKLRESKGMTQVELSSAMNKDQQSLQRVESGNVSPSLYYLYQLALGMEVSLKELMDFEITSARQKHQ